MLPIFIPGPENLLPLQIMISEEMLNESLTRDSGSCAVINYSFYLLFPCVLAPSVCQHLQEDINRGLCPPARVSSSGNVSDAWDNL